MVPLLVSITACGINIVLGCYKEVEMQPLARLRPRRNSLSHLISLHLDKVGGIVPHMEAGTNQFFNGFSAASRKSLLAGMTQETYSDNEYLFHEGDPGDGICLVLEG